MVGSVAIRLLRIRVIDSGFLSDLGTVFFCYVFGSEVHNAFQISSYLVIKKGDLREPVLKNGYSFDAFFVGIITGFKTRAGCG